MENVHETNPTAQNAKIKRFSISNEVVTLWDNSVLVAADTHLAPHAWKSHPEIAGDAYYAFEQIVDLCLLRKPQELWLAGDILDRVDIDPLTVRVLTTQLDRLADAAVPVRFIVGQHERHRLAQWLNIHSWPLYSHEQSWECVLGNCYALDWQPRDITKTSFAAIPRDTDVLLTHHVWLELHGKIMQPECRLADVPHAHTIVTGDYHKWSVIHGNNADGVRSTLFSPGSTAMQSAIESPTKYVLRLPADHQRLLPHHMQCKLKSRDCIYYDLTQPEDLEWMRADIVKEAAARAETWAALPAHLQRPLIFVEYPAEWPKVYQHVAEAIEPYGHLFAKPRVTPTEVVELSTRQVMQLENNLASGIGLVAAQNEPHYLDLLSMLSCPKDPAALAELLDTVLARVEKEITQPVQRIRRRIGRHDADT